MLDLDRDAGRAEKRFAWMAGRQKSRDQLPCLVDDILRTKLGEADQNVVLNLTVKANTSSKVSVSGEASSTIGISAGSFMY